MLKRADAGELTHGAGGVAAAVERGRALGPARRRCGEARRRRSSDDQENKAPWCTAPHLHCSRA